MFRARSFLAPLCAARLVAAWRVPPPAMRSRSGFGALSNYGHPLNFAAMKCSCSLVVALCLLAVCPNSRSAAKAETGTNAALAGVLNDYYEEGLKLYPLAATLAG